MVNLFRLIRQKFRRPCIDGKVLPPFDRTPDEPEEFGYKVLWFAIKASDSISVVDALQFGEATPANWSSGLASVYGSAGSDDHWVFLSPPISNWVFAISWWPYPTVETHHDIGARFDVVFSRLMKRFDDVQFFGSYRVTGFVAWARALNGEPTRIFSSNDGQVLMNFGAQTAEEAKLGMANLTGLSPHDAEDEISRISGEREEQEERLVASGLSRAEARARIRESGRDADPDEEDVVDLAALWSLDPLELSDQDHPPGLGLAVRLPSDLSQRLRGP